jgi:hypothetical protein
LSKRGGCSNESGAARDHMQLPDDSPRLPKLPFLAGDGVLLVTAWLIAGQSDKPLHTTPLVLIVACVALGAVLAAIPFLTDYARQQELAVAERQRALEALARITADAAEQISIAAKGLHTIAELAQKNLQSAEHLPAQLQDKITAVNQRLADAAAAETENLRKELKALRAAETGRLEAAVEAIARVGAEVTRLEGTLREQAAAKPAEPAAAPVPAKSPAPVVMEIPPPTAAAPTVAEAAAPEQARSSAVPVTPTIAEIAPPLAMAAEIPPAAEPLSPVAIAAAAAAPAAAAGPADVLATMVTKEEIALTMPPFAPRAARPPAQPEPATSGAAKEPAPKRKRSKPVENAEAAPAAKVPERTETAAPMPTPESPAPESAATTSTGSLDSGSVAAGTDAAAQTPPSQSRNSNSPMFELGLDDDTALSPTAGFANENFPTKAPFAVAAATRPPPAAAREESSISSDGFTRLLATAYIGIGNKLYVRGDGPGLSWEKGVPLQFVSIGKWRWETPDATAPVTVKLYKNDQQECAALGPVTLEPGRQLEVTADF